MNSHSKMKNFKSRNLRRYEYFYEFEYAIHTVSESNTHMLIEIGKLFYRLLLRIIYMFSKISSDTEPTINHKKMINAKIVSKIFFHRVNFDFQKQQRKRYCIVYSLYCFLHKWLSRQYITCT